MSYKRIVTVLIIVLAVIGVFMWQYGGVSSDLSKIKSVTSKIKTFSPYFFRDGEIGGYQLQRDTVSYEKNVLVFTLKHTSSNKEIIFTEQAIPSGFAIDALQADKEFQTTYGKAYITDGLSRTTGALFTDDKTWILINAPQPIGAESMEQLLSLLKPVR
ncbi:MAG: hypothetical protein ABIQ64_00835 [Candidatus Saccharimonadales bacterium]